MIKRFNEFVNTELDDFYDDLKIHNHRIKLFCEFSSEISSDDLNINNDIIITKPNKKFKPKTKVYNPYKINKDDSKNLF